MSDVEWRPLDEEEPAPPPRRRRWLLLGCGSGCLFLFLICAVGAFLLRDVQDPDAQWPRIREHLAFEERPTNLEIGAGIGFFGRETYYLEDVRAGLILTLYVLPPEEAEAMLDPDPGAARGGTFVDAEAGTVTVQDRECPVVRFSGVSALGVFEQGGDGILIDLRSEGHPGRILQVQRLVGSDGPLTDEEVTEVLAPFEPWKR